MLSNHCCFNALQSIHLNDFCIQTTLYIPNLYSYVLFSVLFKLMYTKASIWKKSAETI